MLLRKNKFVTFFVSVFFLSSCVLKTSSSASILSSLFSSDSSSSFSESGSVSSSAAFSSESSVSSLDKTSSSASNSSSREGSSASSSTVSSSKSGNSSSGSSSVSTSSQTKADYYRVAPISTNEATVNVYDVSYADGRYIGTEITTIARNQDCLNYQDVCLYYEAFRIFPPNYFSKKSQAISYGKSGRLVSTYSKASYQSSSDYTTSFGTFSDQSVGVYYELDIDLDGTYNDGYSLTRGAGRVVIVAAGLTDYGNDPVCFYTEDHYADFTEFYNFAGGWSPLFAGVENSSGSYHNVPTTTDPRITPVTVTFSLGQ